MNLQEKTAVIVGGSQGIGRALAKGLLNEGSNVVIASRTKATLEKTGQEIGAKTFVTDVREEQDLRDLASFAIETFGGIEIWVNCAGLFKKFPKKELLDMDRAHEMFDVNFFGAVLGSRTALDNMQDGVVINILSSAALDARRSVGAKLYAASKWALRGYIDALRSENESNPVQILSVYPGGTKSHLHDEALPEDFANFMSPEYVVDKIIANLQQEHPEKDLIIKRPSVSSTK
ncbi:MAG: SDR family NAD(P)-dependent oxidoreductase [Candidatus Saccharimonadales bacterium]